MILFWFLRGVCVCINESSCLHFIFLNWNTLNFSPGALLRTRYTMNLKFKKKKPFLLTEDYLGLSDFSMLSPPFTPFPFPQRSTSYLPPSPYCFPKKPRSELVSLGYKNTLTQPHLMVCVCVGGGSSACSQLLPTLWASKENKIAVCRAYTWMCSRAPKCMIYALFLLDPKFFSCFFNHQRNTGIFLKLMVVH